VYDDCIPVTYVGLRRTQHLGDPVMVFSPVTSPNKVFGIVINPDTARSLLKSETRMECVGCLNTPAPHDVMVDLLAGGGLVPEAVVIHGKPGQGQPIRGALFVSDAQGHPLDAIPIRPSDGAALALRTGISVAVKLETLALLTLYPIERMPYREYGEDDRDL